MARNGSGTYSKVNTFVASATITAAGHNQNWDDLASEMTNSVAADGQTTMTGPLKASSGTAAAPSHTFGSDPDTGAYRIGANNYGVAVGGAKVLDVATTGLDVTGTVNSSGAVKQAGFALLPVGCFFPYAGAAAPSGYLLCDGSAVSRTTYSDLFSAIGTSYGTGDGSTTFNVPDMKGRVPAGKESSATRLTATYFGGDSTALGATGGLESHDLSLAQLPTGITSTGVTNNTITVVGPTTGDILSKTLAGTAVSFGAGADGYNRTNVASFSGSNNITATVTSNNTSGDAHNIVQPTIITNFIIFAGV
jgi:microcystin-dependent protein